MASGHAYLCVVTDVSHNDDVHKPHLRLRHHLRNFTRLRTVSEVSSNIPCSSQSLAQPDGERTSRLMMVGIAFPEHSGLLTD